MKKSDEIKIQDNDIYNNFIFLTQDERRYKPKSEACAKVLPIFWEKMAIIRIIAKEKGVAHADLLDMLYLNYGLTLGTIPFWQFPEIIEWCKNNWWRNYQMIEPGKHVQLMKNDNDYSLWFKAMERENKNKWQERKDLQ